MKIISNMQRILDALEKGPQVIVQSCVQLHSNRLDTTYSDVFEARAP